jgi:capsular exopolysaccharide synthesis family protein
MPPLVPYTPQPNALTTSSTLAGLASEPDSLDFAAVFEAARRRYGVFLVVFAATLALAIVLILHQKPAYTATAGVMMDPRQLQLFQNNVSQNISGDQSLSTEAVATQVALIQSRGMAEQVVDQLHLDKDPHFGTENLGLRNEIVRGVLGLFGAAPPPPILTPDEKRMVTIADVMSHLEAQRLGLTYVINISYTDPSSEQAAAVANAFARVYIQQSLEIKSDANRQASAYLNSRVRELSDQAAADANTVQQYKIAHNLLGAEGATLTQQEISNLNQQVAAARAEVASDQARLDTARAQLGKGSNGDDVGAVLGSPVVESLRSQRAQVSGQLAVLNSRYGPRYPDVMKAQQQLQDLDVQINTEIQRVISNLQATAQVSSRRLASLEATLNQSRGTLVTDTKSVAGLVELQQKATASQTLYDNYLARFKEIMTSAGTEQSDARILSQAQVPNTPSSPRLVLDGALAVVVAAILGFIAGVVAELLDQSFGNGLEIERRVHAPCIGSIPLLSSVAKGHPLPPVEYIVANPFSVFAESFRNLKVSVVQSSPPDGRGVILAVTSPLSGEGKTTTSVCLGETSSLQGARTIVVDCDLRRRSLQKFMHQGPEIGLVEVVHGDAQLEDAIVVDDLTGVHYLPLSHGKLTATDIFGSVAMDSLLDQLRNRYDFVILDTAPLLALADARILAAKCDAVILLCGWRTTPEDALKSAIRLLRAAGAPLAGVSLTRVDVRKQAAHGYGDSAYYYREASSYHTS